MESVISDISNSIIISKFSCCFQIQKFNISKISNSDIWCLNSGHFAIFRVWLVLCIFSTRSIAKVVSNYEQKWWVIYISHTLWVIYWYLAGSKLFRKVYNGPGRIIRVQVSRGSPIWFYIILIMRHYWDFLPIMNPNPTRFLTLQSWRASVRSRTT